MIQSIAMPQSGIGRLPAATTTQPATAQHEHAAATRGILAGLGLGIASGAALGPQLLKLPGTPANRIILALAGASTLALAGGIIGGLIDRRRSSHTSSAPPDAPRIPETVTGVTSNGAVESQPPFSVKVLATDLAGPVHVTSAPGDSAMYVVEAEGRIKRFDGHGEPSTFVDLTSVVGAGGERGLLSVAFHPDFARNGRLFVNYTDRAGDTHIGELQAHHGVADPASLRDVLVIDQPYGNHNGGQLQFGPDGYLYIGMGDGGAGGDPENRAQDPSSLLGKMLRIDIDHPSGGRPYGIPADNPFASGSGGKAEIYALGVRNPWRFSFDRATGDLWIGDVGQGRWEEVDYLPRGTGAGANLGWDVREGANTFEDKPTGPGHLVDPTLQYSHDEGAAITGGYVYRGSKVPELRGYYVYGDYARDTIRALKVENGRVVDRTEFTVGQRGIVSFGEGPDGELYATTIDGKLLQIGALESAPSTPGPSTSVDTGAPTPADRRQADVQYVQLSTGQGGAMRFDQSVIHVKPGKVEINFTNADVMPHNVVVTGSGINARTRAYTMEGEAQRVEFVARPGAVYDFYCEPHAAAGMTGRIVVDPA